MGCRTKIITLFDSKCIHFNPAMTTLYLEGSDDTPKVILNKEKGIFEISGRSLPEDSVEFYSPVLAWIKEYKQSPNATTTFIFKLDYANTASSKLIQEVMFALEKIKDLKIVWYFSKDDEDMEQAGQEFSEVIDIPFEFKSF